MLIEYVPGGVPLTVEIVSVEFPELPGTVEGLNTAVAPLGRPLAVRLMSPAPPDTGLTVTP